MPVSLAEKSRPRELGIPERKTLCKVAEEQIFTEMPLGGEINTRQLAEKLAKYCRIPQSVLQERYPGGKLVFRNEVEFVSVLLGKKGVLVNLRRENAPDGGQMTVYRRADGTPATNQPSPTGRHDPSEPVAKVDTQKYPLNHILYAQDEAQQRFGERNAKFESQTRNRTIKIRLRN